MDGALRGNVRVRMYDPVGARPASPATHLLRKCIIVGDTSAIDAPRTCSSGKDHA